MANIPKISSSVGLAPFVALATRERRATLRSWLRVNAALSPGKRQRNGDGVAKCSPRNYRREGEGSVVAISSQMR